MNKPFTLNNTSVLTAAFISLHVSLGVAVLNGIAALGLASIVGLYETYRRLGSFGKHRQFILVLAAHTVFMMTVMSWFRYIDAFGWSRIGFFSPQFVLMFALLLASLACSVGTALLYVGFVRLTSWLRLSQQSFWNVYLWALLMLSIELLRSILFAVVVKSNGTPIQPQWNFFSVGLVAIDTPLLVLSRVFGLWGLGFLLYVFGGSMSWTICNRHKKFVQKPVAILSVIAVVLALSSQLSFGDNTRQETRLIAVRQDMSDGQYLENFAHSYQPDDHTTFVVLPEYSNLVHPYANTSVPTTNYDARYTFPELYKDTSTYFVGTEDEYLRGVRYVETYVADGSLQKSKRQVKTFLIPGGEYVIGWSGKLINLVDSTAAKQFMNTRSRQVITDNLPADTQDDVTNTIGIGACSTLIKPYHYRAQVADGAQVLAANVSYEQFANAPEYERISQQFAQLISVSTRRPIAVGARAGEAVIYDHNGSVIARTNDSLFVDKTVSTSGNKTLYVLLGDALIVLLLAAPLAYLVARIYVKR